MIRDEIENLIFSTTTYDSSKCPPKIISDLNKWKWGAYGWTSPASLIFTATWRKYYYPTQDCCKIWAKDELNNPIPGGYSIRSEDESITIPALAKYDLCNGYCSANSGMQGSRAIEKMRTMKRLNKDFDSTQRTIFDLKLFASLLNQINDLSQNEALEVLKYQIVISKKIQAQRITTNASLESSVTSNFKLIDFLAETADPELTKCVVAACYEALYEKSGLTVSGVSDYKTAADARAKKPGDLSIESNGSVLLAIEVKDKTQTIDWNNIDRAKKIIVANPELINFTFVLENRNATVTNIIQEMITSEQFRSGVCNKITFLSVHDLYLSALAVSSENIISSKTGHFLSIAPAVKPDTKEKWLNSMK